MESPLCKQQVIESSDGLDIWFIVFSHFQCVSTGGAFLGGCSNNCGTQADFFANSTDTVVVSFNYRIGALGFLYTGNFSENSFEFIGNGGIDGNFGILDQVLALQWVKDNIIEFGGDPNQVTIFGQVKLLVLLKFARVQVPSVSRHT